MGQELKGKVAIITGAASGIGRATAELFAAEGAQLMLADIDAERGAALARELGDATCFRRTDVANADDVQALVDKAVQRFGALHILFNNAGISGAQHPRFLDDDLSDFHRVIDVNLHSVLLGSRFAGRHMARHGGGVIINNASIAGIMPGQALVSYRASKAAVIHLSKCIAIDLAEYGIRVNCLAPGHIRTPLTAFTLPGMSEEQMIKIRDALAPVWDSNQPLKRHGSPQDVAQTVLFLSTDRAAQITGVVLPIDGGITAGDPVNHLRELFEARARALA